MISDELSGVSADDSPSPSSVGVLIITTGRTPYVWCCLLTLALALRRRAERCVIVDASPRGKAARSRGQRALLARISGDVRYVDVPCGSLADSVRAGWQALSGVEFVLHVEEDFLFLRTLDLDDIVDSLRAQDGAAQYLLMRQRWYAAEFEWPSLQEFLLGTYRISTIPGSQAAIRGHWSFNPSLYPYWLVDDYLSATGSGSSGNFETDVANFVMMQGLTCLLGPLGQTPVVWHIGTVSTAVVRQTRPWLVWMLYPAMQLKRAALIIRVSVKKRTPRHVWDVWRSRIR